MYGVWKECRLLECDNKVYLRGFCSYHYDKQRKDKKKCLIPYCLTNARKSGLCYKHGTKRVRIKCKKPECDQYTFKNGLCEEHSQEACRCQMDKCSKDSYCKNLCKLHYNRQISEKKKRLKSETENEFNNFLDLAQILR